MGCCDMRLSMDPLARDVRRWNGGNMVLAARVEQGKTLAAASGTRILKHVLSFHTSIATTESRCIIIEAFGRERTRKLTSAVRRASATECRDAEKLVFDGYSDFC